MGGGGEGDTLRNKNNNIRNTNYNKPRNIFEEYLFVIEFFWGKKKKKIQNKIKNTLVVLYLSEANTTSFSLLLCCSESKGEITLVKSIARQNLEYLVVP